ncbi:MAG: hypothetical protein PHE21_01735 [Candidatus Dojkabacteria bacterium]|nr:hypothetical protein [Candidatus Dojkabacteria bacterium]
MKKIYIFLLTLFFTTLSYSCAFAFSYSKVEDQKFDTSLSNQASTIYKSPGKIYVTQITTKAPTLEKNPDKWSKALYYYAITRLSFADLPYNYLLGENGQIYEGRQGGIGVNPELRNIDGAIVIGYMSNDPILTNAAGNSLLTMSNELSRSLGITSYAAVKLKISQKEGALSVVTPDVIEGDFAKSVKESLANWKSYSRENLVYKAKIEEVVYTNTVVIGSKLEVKVKVKNMNDFNWLTDRNPIYISTKDGKESNFSINAVWDSFSKPTHIEDKVVKPGEIVEFTFQMQPKVMPGDASENFEVMKFDKKPFTDSSFEVKFTVSKGDYTLVRVNSPQYGFVHIRECQWYSCEIVESAKDGTVFILQSEKDGWMRITYDEGKTGWVYSKYMKRI